jgi:anti-sigma B factor antagonist
VAADEWRGRDSDLELLEAAGRWAPGGRTLQIQIDHDTDGHGVCRPVGELDASTVSDFRAVLTELATKRHVVIDLSDVDFIDSAGLGALIGGIRRTREMGGDVALACPRPTLARLLRTTGIDQLVTVAQTVDEAQAALAEGQT